MDEATIAAYERGATAWRDHRPARFLDRVGQLTGLVADGAVAADLGCGAGLHLPSLPRPVVALDGAFEMVRLAREVAPDALAVQADLEHLPFRRGVLGGAWARASYLHVPRAHLPIALADLHQAVAVDGPVHLTMMLGDAEGELPDDEFPGRFFARWEPEPLRDVLVGAGFDIALLGPDPDQTEWLHALARRARTLPDTVGPEMRLLVCGLNPSILSADLGVGFARRGNRFWPAALDAGIVTVDRDPRHALVHHHVGMTDLAKRATARADELSRDEYREGATRVEHLVRWLRPGAVCFVGLAGYRAAVDRHALAGVQPERFGGRPAYVMPSTSGLNARTSPAELAEHLHAAARLADISTSGDSVMNESR